MHSTDADQQHVGDLEEVNRTNGPIGSVYLPPLPGLRVVLPVLSLPHQVWEHQGFEGARARRPGVSERVHHAEVPPVAHGAQGARAQAPRGVQAVHADHAPDAPRIQNPEPGPESLYRVLAEKS